METLYELHQESRVRIQITKSATKHNRVKIDMEELKKKKIKGSDIEGNDKKNVTLDDITSFEVNELSELNTVDVNKVCRICLSQEDLSPLFESRDYAIYVYLHQAFDKMPTQNQPKNICNLCHLQLRAASSLILKLKLSTAKLQKLFDRNQETECTKQELSVPTSTHDDVEEIIIIEEDFMGEKQENQIKKELDDSKSFQGLKCDLCNRKFNYFTSWQCHMAMHEEIDKSKSQYCYVDEEKYNEHSETAPNKNISSDSDSRLERIASLTIDGNFKCNTCDMIFNGSAELNLHLPSHNEYNHQCDFCGKTFVDSIILERHLERVHVNKNIDQRLFKVRPRPRTTINNGYFVCKICKKSFTVKSNLTRHMSIIHDENKRFCCEICGEKFTVKNSLKYHMYIHTDSRPFACKLCHKAFRQQSALIRHQRTKHNQHKKFACDICLKQFKTSKGLEKHSVKHLYVVQ